MAQIAIELQQLKEEVINMWALTINQLSKAKNALLHFDQDLAREVMITEKRVNSFELKIDRGCENIFALFTPVAIDLRFVLAVLKINSNLERLGDLADSISNYITRTENAFSPALLRTSRVIEMFELALSILEDTLRAFEFEDTNLARSIFHRDEALNEINMQAIPFTKKHIQEYQEETDQALNILSIIRKIERIGDHSKNIAEEIIFYVEAKVLKHTKGNA
jgi:phosphate transport system protein